MLKLASLTGARDLCEIKCVTEWELIKVKFVAINKTTTLAEEAKRVKKYLIIQLSVQLKRTIT